MSPAVSARQNYCLPNGICFFFFLGYCCFLFGCVVFCVFFFVVGLGLLFFFFRWFVDLVPLFSNSFFLKGFCWPDPAHTVGLEQGFHGEVEARSGPAEACKKARSMCLY